MGDHFWPAIYPGIIIGLLMGLSARTLATTVLGAIGGLAGAVLFFFLVDWLGLQQDILRLLGLIGVSALGANFLIGAGQWVMQILANRARPSHCDDSRM